MSMNPGVILLFTNDGDAGIQIERSYLKPAGFKAAVIHSKGEVDTYLSAGLPVALAILDMAGPGADWDWSIKLIETYPAVPFLLLAPEVMDREPLELLRLGAADCLRRPLDGLALVQAIRRALKRKRRLQEWFVTESNRHTQTLQDKIGELESLGRIGREVNTSLDLDHVLRLVMDSAVELTGAEEGSLLLLDEASGDLHMRAARNFQESFVRTFRLRIDDSMAGHVIRTGKPLLLDNASPEKIKTSYLVQSLIYVPLAVKDKIIGVLGVDHRSNGRNFTQHHLALMNTLASYAAVALENAALYSETAAEKNKLETILSQIEDGVIVVDAQENILLANYKVRQIFHQDAKELAGRPLLEYFTHSDIKALLEIGKIRGSGGCEITTEDKRVFRAQVTGIPEVGLALTFMEITQLKELNRIKSDFFSTISHDLRSPLTAIIGYSDLVVRVGALTEQQKQFLSRIKTSANTITALINDLLALGRIEAGFDNQKEIVELATVLQQCVDTVRPSVMEKKQNLVINLAPQLPQILGNPIRLGQLISNILSNAVKYSPKQADICVRGFCEDGQLIFQVQDTGIGIPAQDQPYIYEKYFRASNIPSDIPGTGLGLAIVKTIVDNHQGRIWVESESGQGTIFTVVFPKIEDKILGTMGD